MKAKWPSPTWCTRLLGAQMPAWCSRLPWCTCLVGKLMPAWSLLCERPELFSLSVHVVNACLVHTPAVVHMPRQKAHAGLVAVVRAT